MMREKLSLKITCSKANVRRISVWYRRLLSSHLVLCWHLIKIIVNIGHRFGQ